jgi:tripartite-type tricarboxylate transporter receptor subunit TctC
MSGILTRVTLLAAALGLFTGTGGSAIAQSFPSRTVKLVVAVPPGGVTDAMARIVAQRLTEAWGQTVGVENRPSANYAAGAQAVSVSPPDGLTLLVAPDATVTASPHLFSKLPYNPLKELTPIIVLCRITPVLAVNASLPVHDVQQLVALAKAKPGSLNYGSFGIGHYTHLSMEDFKQKTGTDMLHIPYRGAPQATVALLTGDVGVELTPLSSVEAHEKDGKVRIIAAAGEKRAVLRPNLRTVAEQGVPGFSTTGWFAMWGPANMPPDLVRKIHADVTKVLELPQSREFFQTNSFERVELTPDQFAQLAQDDFKHWGALIKALGVKLD